MFRALRTILVVTFSVVLALPPGWCCCYDFGRVLPGTQADANDTPPCCCHCAAPAAPTTNDGPQPVPPGNCPCDERNTTTVAETQIHTPDFATPALLPLLNLELQAAGGHAPTVVLTAVPPGTTSPLHVLHCFWLC